MERIFKNILGYLSGLSVMIITLVGCKPKPIDLELEPHVPKLVIASQIIPDQTMFVSLTRSFSALSNSTTEDQVNPDFLKGILVESAFVTISYLGRTDTLSIAASGIYASATTLQYDYGTYTLYAKDLASGMEVSAVSTLLPIVRFDSIIPVVQKTSTDTTVSLDISFTDIPGIDNWYVIYYYSKKDAPSDTNLDINTYFNRGSNQLEQIDLLSDKTFENGKYHAIAKMENIRASDTIAVALSNISEGYFQFLHTYKKSGNVINQLTGEPINYPTNVNSGYGYFTTHYPDVRFYNLSEY